MDDEKLFKAFSDHINPTYSPFLERLGYRKIAGQAYGCEIFDSEGNSYLDCIAGYGLISFGHNNPDIIRAIKGVCDDNALFTKPFIVKEQVKLAQKLAEITPGDLSCSFMCNSGSEAVDTAIKLARLFTGKSRILCAKNSFHGFTFGALSASGIESFKRLFKPLVPDIVHVEFGNAGSLQRAITPDTAAVLLEPLQHESGVNLPPAGYFSNVREICDERNVVMILDEIKTGFGRTGERFACNHHDVVPDVMILGKALGGGLIPAGAVVADKRLWRKTGYSFPMFASSFAGNTLACAAADAVIDILEESGIVKDCAEKGEWLFERLAPLPERYPHLIKKITGKGLLFSIEANGASHALSIIRHLAEDKILTAPAFGNPSVIMLEPPLVITHDQLNTLATGIENACLKRG